MAIVRVVTILMVLGILGTCAGCGDAPPQQQPKFREQTGKSAVAPSIEAKAVLQKAGAGLVASADASKVSAKIFEPKIAETDFIENAKRRDPFRPFVEVIVPEREVRETVQREIKLEEYDIEQLKLIAIITNVGDPRAMVVPPNGIGFILRRGDYVGKADYVDPGSGAERIQINWRVYRIHGAGPKEERGIYLVRDDPMTPTPNDVTRFLPLYPQE